LQHPVARIEGISQTVMTNSPEAPFELCETQALRIQSKYSSNPTKFASIEEAFGDDTQDDLDKYYPNRQNWTNERKAM